MSRLIPRDIRVHPRLKLFSPLTGPHPGQRVSQARFIRLPWRPHPLDPVPSRLILPSTHHEDPPMADITPLKVFWQPG